MQFSQTEQTQPCYIHQGFISTDNTGQLKQFMGDKFYSS